MILPLADMPIWAGVLGIIASFFGTGGVILAFLHRRWQLEDARKLQEKQQREQEEKETRDALAGKMTFEGLNLSAMTEAREQWRKDIHDQAQKHQVQLDALTLQIEELRDDNDMLRSTQVETYLILQQNQWFFDQVRARGKDGSVTFLLSELPPHIDLEKFSPGKVFTRNKRKAKAQTQEINLNIVPALPPP